MAIRDLIKMSLQNLRRRKSRTMLTVLGVVIGCCSIVIMISLGIGMKEAQEKMLSEMGDLTVITITPPSGGKGKLKLNGQVLSRIEQLPNVPAATPKFTPPDGVSIRLGAGNDRRYLCDWASVAAYDGRTMDAMGFHLLEGGYLSGENEILLGELAAYGFRDTMKPDGMDKVDYYGAMYGGLDGAGADGVKPEPPTPLFDPMKTPLHLILEKENGEQISVPLTPVGRLKEDYNKGYETADGIVMDIAVLEKLLKDAGVTDTAPPSKGYQSILVKVKDISSVESVEQQIRSIGFLTQSMESIRKPMEKEARQKQMMLGGLGAISLLVAAIGITNTMIMSISERTREIGIMKSLGCFVRDIRIIFLAEAGIIGFLGGIAGSIISVLTSLLMNVVSSPTKGSLSGMVSAMTQKGGRISVVPLWLICFAILFSVSIGLASGYYPANKAVQIPALEAIKGS